MNFVRSLFVNRIGGQIALLILASLIAIHALITASLFIGHRGALPWPRDDGTAPFVTTVKLIAASPPGERASLLSKAAHAFPQMRIERATAMPAVNDTAQDDMLLRFLAHGLGPRFRVAALPAPPQNGATTSGVAVRLPDGAILTAHLPPPAEPPTLGGPIALTLLFIVVSVTLLGLWAARALRRPLSSFAEAAEGFNLDGDFAALPERGPEEVRVVARAFNRMRDRIRSLVDDRTRMLAAMGHDLRTPITRLRLRSEFIADVDLRQQMLRDLDQMRAMTDSVLSFLRDGKARDDAIAVDLASSLQTICDQFADLGHDVTYHGPDHARLIVHADDLQRAVANLVDNAVRHGTRVTARLVASGGTWRIEVEDDGPGIADDSKAAMLEAFVRGEEARTMDDRIGFGLGLAIAHAVAEAHGGALTLHDRAPHGLIARITLPIEPKN